jgi:hypothetical protein
MKRYKLLFMILPLLPLAALLVPANYRPHFHMTERAGALVEWLPPAMAGLVFTTLGFLKVYGWKKGIVGGGGKSATCRLFGRCPSWSKQFNITVIVIFFGIGIVNLGICFVALLKR